MSLKAYLDTKNRFGSLFNQPALGYPKTVAECRKIRNMIEGDLSPENLTCDGELPSHRVRERSRTLNAALAELSKVERSL